MSRRRRAGSVVVLGVVLIAVSACGGGAADVSGAGGPDSTATSDVAGSSSDTSSPTTSTPPPSTPPSGMSPQRIAASSAASLPAPTAADLRAARSTPVEDPYYPSTSNPEVDALHYALGLDWDGSTLVGDTLLTFRPAKATDRIRLDLSDALRVTTVRLDGQPIAYHQPGDDGLQLRTGSLEVGSVHTLEIAYRGRPTSTPEPSHRSDAAEGLGWNVDVDGSVHTFQEPYGAFTWYPVNDHPSDKALYDAAITTAGGDVAVFNGDLLSSTSRDGRTTNRWHLDSPAASYLITVAIGPYDRSTATTPSGMTLSYWVEPRDAHLLPALEREGSLAFEWLQDHAGPFPFSSLGVVVVGGDSAMETQTMITMSRFAVVRPDAVLEHEMAHQWYGDSLTPRDWQGLWLNEGWAMYMQQWYEHDSDRPVYAGGIPHWRPLDQASRRTSGPPGDYRPGSFADLNVYLGPAMMLDAIRLRLGDAAFGQLVKAWPTEHAHSTVDRAMFTRWLRRDTGVDFTPLIHRWLDSARTPPTP